MRNLETYRFWGYAATFGALWGAVEITVGSFLHALRIPFSGVVLAGFGAALLIALRRVFPVPGVMIAAGLVCAGVKLLSPAGAVVGPIVAILAESLLVEATVRWRGATILSGSVAGALAALWSVLQKLVTQTLFFGMPVLGIYQGIARQAERTLRLPASEGLAAVGLFLSIVVIGGAMFGVVGAWVGKATCRRLVQAES